VHAVNWSDGYLLQLFTCLKKTLRRQAQSWRSPSFGTIAWSFKGWERIFIVFSGFRRLGANRLGDPDMAEREKVIEGHRQQAIRSKRWSAGGGRVARVTGFRFVCSVFLKKHRQKPWGASSWNLLVLNLANLLNSSFNFNEGFSQRRTEAYKF
jgi:hypothetical protein